MWSQFGELAATDDGQQLYFSSALTLADMPASRSESRIYRVVPEGIQLFAEREPSPPGPCATVSFGSNDGAAKPQVSGDGLTVGLTLHNVCVS